MTLKQWWQSKTRKKQAATISFAIGLMAGVMTIVAPVIDWTCRRIPSTPGVEVSITAGGGDAAPTQPPLADGEGGPVPRHLVGHAGPPSFSVVARQLTATRLSTRIQYVTSSAGGEVQLVPQGEYLNALRAGARVPGVYRLGSIFWTDPPVLHIAVLNKTSDPAVITEVVVRIGAAAVDTTPLIVAESAPLAPGMLVLRNEGWGRPRRMRVTLEGWGRVKQQSDPLMDPEVPCGSLERMFEDGRIVEPVRYGEEYVVDTKSLMPSELAREAVVCAFANVSYGGPGGRLDTVRFATPVFMSRAPAPMPLTPQVFLDVTLIAGRPDTTYRRAVMYEVARHERGQVDIRFFSDRSAIYSATVEAHDVAGEVVARESFWIRMIVPRGGSGDFLHYGSDLRWSEASPIRELQEGRLSRVGYSDVAKTVYLVSTDTGRFATPLTGLPCVRRLQTASEAVRDSASIVLITQSGFASLLGAMKRSEMGVASVGAPRCY